MKHSPTYRPIYRLRVFTACLLSLLMITAPMAPLAASANGIATESGEQRTGPRTPKGSLSGVPLGAPPAPVITATLDDSFIDTTPVPDGRADPNSVVTYTASITNSGGADATGVNFTDTISPYTTLIGGSIKISPRAIADSYNATQDTLLDTAASSLPTVLANDTGTPAPTVSGVVGCADVTAPFTCNTTQAGGSVTLNTDGSFSYTPPSGFTGTDTFTYKATNGLAPDDTATVTITVGCGAITVTNPATNTGTINTAFNQTFMQTGGVGTTNFTLNSGTLPNGLTLATNGTLSGTPTQSGSFPITVKATDSNACTGVGPTYTLTINQAPTITSANNTTFTVGTPGTFSVTTTGFPAPSIANGGVALPSGVSFVDNGNGTGTLSGTAGAGTGGTYAISFTATNTAGSTPAQSFTLTIRQAPAITSANNTTFTVGTPGTFTVTTTGFPTPTIARGGVALPSGVSFVDNGNGTGTLSGTPGAGTGGTYAITFTATNVVGSTPAQTFTLTINQAPVITSANNTTFTVGTLGTFTVTTTGFPAPSIANGGVALPSGVSFVDNGNGTGTLSGTPGAGTGGTYAISFTATNVAGSTPAQSFTLTIRQAPAITSANNTTFTVGTPGTFTVTTTGFPTPTIARGGVALPSGVSFVDNGNGTGTLSGTPGAGTGGTYAITFTATNVVGSTPAQTFTLTINQAPVITSANNTTFTVGTPGTFSVTTTGFPAPSIARGGVALPTGVSFVDNGNGTGTLSGTPGAGTGGTYAISFTATNVVGSTPAQSFTLTIRQAPAITSANNTTFVVGSPGTFTVTTTGFPTPTIARGGVALPSGVNFVDNGDGTGTLSGTPGAGTGGTYAITFTATNVVGSTPAQSFTLTIQQAPAFTSANNTTFAPGKTGQVFAVTASGFPNNTFTFTGTFPTGVTLVDNGNGTAQISGTPAAGTQSGSPYNTIVLKASNSVNPDATQNFTLNIVCPVITVSGAATLNLTHNVAMSTSNYSQSGGNGTITWSAPGLPTGVSINSATGDVTGTPSVTGTFSVTVTATDAGGCTGTKSITVNVVPNLQSQAYTGVGNTQFFITGAAGAPTTPAVASANGLLTGATPAGNVTVTGASCSVGGTLTAVDSSGHFIFTPNISATSATCTYTASSNTGVGSTGPASATANLTFTLNNKVWYVNSSGSNGDGRSNSPFNTMTGADTAANAVNDYIFVHTGGATTTGNISLLAGQTLWGQGTTFTLGPLTIASGTKPTLTGTVTLGGNTDTVSSLDISSGTSTGITNSATITGALVENSVTVTTTTGTGVSFNNIAGTLTFTGLSTNGGAGANLTGSNGSATFNFSNVTISSAANAGFTSTGGGTLVITGAANTIASTTGTALNVANTTIGASGLTFRSISVTGNGTLPSSGIILTNTGTNAGLTVTGNGGACTQATQTCTGGTITGTGSHGVWLTTVKSIEFNLVSIKNTADHGLFGDGVDGFTLRDSIVFNFGNGSANGPAGPSEDGLHFESTNNANTAAGHGLTGTVIIQRDAFGPDGHFSLTPNPPTPQNKGIVIRNHNDTNLSMTVTGSTFFQISDDGIDTEVTDGTGTLSVDGTTADGANVFNQINGRAVEFQNPVDNAVARVFDLTIKNNTFTNVGIGGRWLAAGRGTMNARYLNNTMTSTANDAVRSIADAVNSTLTPHATTNATITGNAMGGGGIFIAHHRQAVGNIAFNNNTGIGPTGGIFVSAEIASTVGIDIISNSATVSGNAGQNALYIQAANNGVGASTICANIKTNTLTESPNNTGFQSTVVLDTVGGAGDINLEGWNGTSPTYDNFISGQNTLSGGTPNVIADNTAHIHAGGNCVTSTPLLVAPDGVNAAPDLKSVVSGFDSNAWSVIAPSRAVVTESLSQQQLDAVVSAALERWSTTGLTPQQFDSLRGIKFAVAHLEGSYLGDADGNSVLVDRDAKGRGWFVDSSPQDDSEFAAVLSSTRRQTNPFSLPAGHVDLLTAIEHEMGHKLGLPDTYAERDRDNLMYGYLTVGERRLPASGQARNAKPGNQTTQHLRLRSASAASIGTLNRLFDTPVTPFSGETVNVNIGTLPAGKSITITFQVRLNTAMPAGTTEVSTRGTVHYAEDTGGVGGAGVPTNDPSPNSPHVSNGPTFTPVDTPTAAGSSVGGQILDGNGNPVEGAGIRMSGTQNRLTVTDAQGNYHFDNVDTGGFYTVAATRANFSFSPASRSFSALGQTTDAAFSATLNGNALNPLDTTEYFVRQQYVDFLNREPDEAGLNFWYTNIESCGNDAQCRAGKRIDTSAAFFLSTEFQQTGYLVYKSYQAAFGDLPGMPVPVRLGEFKPDTQEIGKGVIVNAPAWDTTLAANKSAFMAEFVQRPRFASAYAQSLTPTEFVNRLFANAGVTPSDTDRSAAVNEFGSAGTSADVAARGRALQRVAENSMLTQQEFTRAFVLIQYFGYLRRDPNTGPDTDFSGYNFWLQKLNTFNGNFGDAEMVKSFLVSGEYRGRFPR